MPDDLLQRLDNFLKSSTPSSGKTAAYKKRTKSSGKPDYDSLYDKYGQEWDVDPDLLIAQGQQESSFKNNAVSSAGARGLGQFMPDTAAEFKVNVNDPASSIRGQAQLMRKLLDRTNDVGLSLAGYNSGHNASIERLKRNAERIPETRDYIKKILGNYGQTTVPTKPDTFWDDLRGLASPPKDTFWDDLRTVAKSEGTPTPEKPDTLIAQIESANDPKVRTRFGVLATEPTQATLFANQPNFKPFDTKEGTLWLNTAKIYADKKLRLKNEKDLKQYLKNPKALTTLIGIAEDVGRDTQGTAVVAKKGNVEQASAIVRSPETAEQQIAAYQDQFPDAEIGITTSDEVVRSREVPGFAEEIIPANEQPYDIPVTNNAWNAIPAEWLPKTQKQAKKAVTPAPQRKVAQNAVKQPKTPIQSKLTEQDYQDYFKEYPDVIDTPANRMTAEELYKAGKWNTASQRKRLGESAEPVILDEPEVQRVSAQDADNAIADTFDVNGMSIGDATKKVRSQLSAKYGKDFSGLVLTDTQGNPLTDPEQLKKPIVLTYGKLKTYGVDPEPLVAQRVAETRIEDPEPNLEVKSDFSAEDAESLNNTFGTTIGSAIASTLNAGGNTANAMAGLLKIIQELNPAKLDSMAEAAKLKPYRAGEDVIKYLQGIGASTGALAAKTGDKYYESATADDVGYLEGRPVEKETWATTGGKAVGALAEMPRIALMPGGLAAPMLSFATDSMLQAAAQGEEVDWNKVKKAGKHGAVLGGIAQFTPFVGKAGDTAISTLLNKASSNVLREGITLGTIGGSTYVASRAMGASKDAAFREAVLFSAMHGFSVLQKMIGEPIRVKDTNGNEAVIRVDKDGKVETLDPKTEAQAQMVIPKEVETKIGEYLKKDAKIQAEAKTDIGIEKPKVKVEEKLTDVKEPDIKPVNDVNIKTPVAKKLDAVKQLQQEKREALAEIEPEARSLEAQGQVQEAKKLRDDITAEYNAKILEAKKKPTVEPKVQTQVAPLTPTKPKVAPKAKSETGQKVTKTLGGKTFIGEVYRNERINKDFVRYTKANGEIGNTPLNDTWKPVDTSNTRIGKSEVKIDTRKIVDEQITEKVADTTLAPEKVAEDILKTYESANTQNTRVEPTKKAEVKADSNVGVKSKGEPEIDARTPRIEETSGGQRGTGQTPDKLAEPPKKPSKIGVSIERKTVEKGLTETFEGTAEYSPTTVKEQAGLIADVLTDPARVRRIIDGQEAVPPKLRQSYFIKGVEDVAIAKGDVETLKALAKSKLTSETSTFAQEMRMMGERSPDSVTQRIKELRKIRREAFKGKGHDTEVVDKKIADLEKQLEAHTKTIAKLQEKADIAEITAEQNVTRPLLDRAEKYAQRLRADAEKSREALKKRGNVFTSGIDPVALGHLAKIGASHIADLGIDFAKFSDKMIAEFGDKIKPHLKEIYDKAQDVATRFERRALKMINTRLEKQIADLERQIETKTRDVIKREPLKLDAKGEALRAKRDDLRKELDALIPKTRTPISDAKYNELRAKSLQKQIQSLDEQIRTGVRQSRETRARELSPEVARLIEKRNELREKHTEVFGRPEMSDAKRLQAWKKHAENRIAILKGEKEAPTKSEPITTRLDAEGENLRTQINVLKQKVDITDTEIATIADMTKNLVDARAKLEGHQREPLGKATPEEIAYATAKVELSEYVDNLKMQANRTSFSEFKEASKKDKAKILAKGVGKMALAHPGFTKNILASIDASATLLTGWRMMLAHPALWARNAAKGQADIVKTFGNRPVAEALKIDIHSRPNAINGKYDKMGVDVSTREEDFPMLNPFGRLAKVIDKIPTKGTWTPSNIGKQALKSVPNAFVASENAFVGFQHRNRADLADLLLPRFEGRPRSDTDYKNLGRLINSLTGRGYLGKSGERASEIVNVLMFAPRFLKSELDAFGHILTGGATLGELAKSLQGKEGGNTGTNFVRAEAIKNLAKFVAGTATVLGIANALKPGSVDFDPRSADFGKIKIGNTRFDVSGHMGSLFTLAARIATGESKSSTTGKITKLNEKDDKGQTKWGGRTTLDLFEDFVEGKASPYGHAFIDWLKGQDFHGNPVDLTTYKSWDRMLTNMHTPLPIQNVKELMNDPNAAPIWAGIIADYFGATTSTYGGSKHVLRLMKEAKERGDDAEVKRLEPILQEEYKIEAEKNKQRREEVKPTTTATPSAMPMQQKK